jgi:hypothetical protein
MAGDTQSWVAQYGDALANLDSYTKSLAGGATAQPGAGVIAPAQQGAFAAAAQAGAPTPGGLQPPGVPGISAPAPQPPGALTPPAGAKPALPSAGLPPPADVNSNNPHNFHNVWNGLPDDQKQQITDHMEDQLAKHDTDIETTFKKMQDDGVINAPTADYAKKDMAGFVMEAGLRMAQAGARGDYYSNPFASAATGILGAVESRRERQLQAGQMAFNQQNTQYQRELDLAKLKQEERLGIIQRDTQIRIAEENEKSRLAAAATSAGARTGAAQILANSRTAAAGIEANKPTANNTITDENGNVFWKGGPRDGKPVMVDDGNGGQRQIKVQQKTAAGANKTAFSEKDVESAVSKHEADMNKNGYTAKIDVGGGNLVPWSKATEDQKNAHLDQYAASIRSRAAASGPQGGQPTGGNAANNPYAKYVKTGSAGAKPAAAPARSTQEDAENEVVTGEDDSENENERD